MAGPSQYGNTNVNVEFVRTPLNQYWNLVSPGDLELDASVTGSVIPSTNDANDLGSATNRWKDLYLGSDINAAGALRIITGGAGAVYIAADGSVGIGQSSPSGAKLWITSAGAGYGGYPIYINSGAGVLLNMFDNGELHINPGTAYETIKHTSGRWDFPNVVSIGKPTVTGIEAFYLKGLGNTSGTYTLKAENLGGTELLRIDDGGTTFLRALNGLVSSVPVQGGIYLNWVSDGGISNARLLNCSVVSSDITFANNYGISGGLGYVKLGDTTALSQFGGGVSNYIRHARLSQNYDASLDRFPLPANGGFTWVAQYTPHLGRYTIMTEIGKQQVFSDTGWVMPIGTASKDLGDADENTTVSASPTQTEVQEIADRLRDTRRVLKALIDHLGNTAVAVTLDNTTDIVQLTGHGLQQRHRVKFISGTLPAELALDTWYYITDGTVNANDFQISATYGGAAINFTSDGSNIFMQIDYSGMNLLAE